MEHAHGVHLLLQQHHARVVEAAPGAVASQGVVRCRGGAAAVGPLQLREEVKGLCEAGATQKASCEDDKEKVESPAKLWPPPA